MGTTTERMQVKSTEIEFKSEKEYDDFVKLINNPPEPNQRVKRLIKQYQSQREKKDDSNK
ncbi:MULTISPECIES: type II toxin -antitoxin system TacA 1-like antitoxin [unclassified Oceanobacillus]|uniref:type II toxin -antitoxin system TacA 1-like antitoxin n=1 Tax=unclassified Oceanobacillus TaxID=2630292 RepID=UPI00300DF28F